MRTRTRRKGSPGQDGRPGILAVASEAKVSIATVSRVLNNQRNVQPHLAERVRQAIEKTGYLADTSARALSSGRTKIFGIIISSFTNPFFPELLQSFEERAVNLGYEVLVASTAYDQNRMGLCIDRMLERKVDGVAVMTFGMEESLLNEFVDRGVPLVFMDEAPSGPNARAILVDYQTGIDEAVKHLAELGHQRIGFVAGPQRQASVAHRIQAVDQAMRRLGLPRTAELTYSGDHSLKSGEQALEYFTRLRQPPTALLCSNDLSAIGVMHGAEAAGISIPRDLSLVGFDGIEIGAYIVPPLTSVAMSRRKIAEAAVNTLWNSIEGRPFVQARIGTRLLMRRTTAPPRVAATPGNKARVRG
jgi:DNA-binding LacI/PurR family transcriptional regulator